MYLYMHVCVYIYIYIYIYIYTVSHRSEYTPHIFVNILLFYYFSCDNTPLMSKPLATKVSITWANILFTIKHRKHSKCLNWPFFKMLCTRWAHFKCYACYRSQNSWDRGHIYHGVGSCLLFKSVWKRLGIEVMSFWSFSVGIWSHSCLI